MVPPFITGGSAPIRLDTGMTTGPVSSSNQAGSYAFGNSDKGAASWVLPASVAAVVLLLVLKK